MSRKTYTSLGANPLSVDVLIGGKLASADFTGGMVHPVVKMPRFYTRDKAMQEALESYPGFNTSFELTKTELDEGEEEASVETIIPSNEDENAPDSEVDTPNGDVVPPGPFATVKDAKQWLHDNKDIPFNKMPTKEIMLAVAAELGIVLEFETK